jgi:phospholipase/lecithinase/hemolysin
VLFDVPDLGKTPSILADGPVAVAAASALSYFFDQQVLADLAPVVQAGLKVFDIDTYARIDAIVADPGAFGFSNATDACYSGEVGSGGGTVCSDPNSYLFWDAVHPTAAGHEIVAGIAYGLTTPEPSTWVMMLLSFAGLGAVGALKNRSAAAAS